MAGKTKVGMILAGLLLVAGGLFSLTYGREYLLRQKAMDELGITTVETHRTEKQQIAIIEEYPEVAAAFAKAAKENDGRMFPIPGLQRSVTFKLGEKKIVVSHDMTPQGIAVTEDYIYISQYDHTHKHNSVVQMMDRTSHQLIKTIVVPGKPHLGGLVYDPTHENLWLATESPDGATLSKLTQKAIDDYDIYEDQKPIKYQNVVSVWNVLNASMIAYLEPFIVVGYFDKNAQGSLAMYPLDKQGNLTSLIEDTQKFDGGLGEMDSKNAITDDTTNIMKKIQGIAYYKNYMLMSQSFGPNNSKLYVYDLQDTVGGFTGKSAKAIIDFPPYLEQITAEGDHLFALFESGSKAYWDHTDKNVEYVLELDLGTLLKDSKKES